MTRAVPNLTVACEGINAWRMSPEPRLSRAPGPEDSERVPTQIRAYSEIALDKAGVEVDAFGELRHVLVRHRHRLSKDDPLDALGARRCGE